MSLVELFSKSTTKGEQETVSDGVNSAIGRVLTSIGSSNVPAHPVSESSPKRLIV